MEKKIKTLIENLTEKTKKKETIWERVGKSDQFILSLSSGKVSADKFVTKQGNLVYQFIIYNSKGDPIVTINGIRKDEFLPQEEYATIKLLHDSIKHNYFKVDETIESLINETKKPGEIGKEREDLPF
jgi:hypothetical protein